MGGAIGAWSSIQEPWERDCFYFMVLFLFPILQFCKTLSSPPWRAISILLRLDVKHQILV